MKYAHCKTCKLYYDLKIKVCWFCKCDTVIVEKDFRRNMIKFYKDKK